MALVFLDNFIDVEDTLLTAHTPDIGIGWIAQESAPRLDLELEIGDGNVARPTEFEGNSRIIALADHSDTSNEYVLSMKMALPADYPRAAPIFMIARYQNGGDFYFAGGYSPYSGFKSRNGVFIGRSNNEYISIIASNPNVGLIANRTYKFLVTNDNKELFVDNVSVLRTDDNGLPDAGGVGLGFGSIIDSRDDIRFNARIDSFSVNTTLAISQNKPEIPFVRVATGNDSQIQLYRWSGLNETNVGQPLVDPRLTRKTVQAVGTFGGGVVELSGSVSPPGSPLITYNRLENSMGLPVSMVFSDVIDRINHAFSFRPVAFGGNGMDITVYLLSVQD